MLEYIPSVGMQPIELGKEYTFGKESWRFQTVKFYVSEFTSISAKGKVLNRIPTTLVNLEDSSSQSIGEIDAEAVRIDFLLGTDSLCNVSGILEGALDPINGMYWAWNSGYIQFKCTGRSSAIPLIDQTFEYHLGGYRQPFETVLPIELPIIGNQLILNIKPFFEHTVNFQKVQRVMIPGRIAQWYCQELTEHFRSE
jgi:hypothetical protein